MADLSKLVAEARAAAAEEVAAPEAVVDMPTAEEVAEAREEAAQAIAQSREEAVLNDREEFDVNPFKPVSSITEILENTLKAEFADAALVQSVVESLTPVCEKMNKTILTQEGRETFARSMASTLKMQQEQKKIRVETDQYTRESLLRKRFGEEGAVTMKNSYNESLRKVFGDGYKQVVDNMPPELYVSRVVEHHNQEKQNYLSWKTGNGNTAGEYQGSVSGSLVEDKKVTDAKNKIAAVFNKFKQVY